MIIKVTRYEEFGMATITPFVEEVEFTPTPASEKVTVVNCGCRDCGHKFSVTLKYGEEFPYCENCGSNNIGTAR